MSLRQVASWDRYFLDLATAASARSKDPRTQVGCIIVGPDMETLATGYNGFPRSVQDTEDRWEKDSKAFRVVHAEANAIASAARIGTPLFGGKLYVTRHPCIECAKLICAVGIARVVVDGKSVAWHIENSSWLTTEIALFIKELMEESGVRLEFV